MGSVIASLIAYIPLYVIVRLLIRLWRLVIAPKIYQSKLYQGFMKLPLAVKITDIAHSIDERL
jgi:hypothetical protein